MQSGQSTSPVPGLQLRAATLGFCGEGIEPRASRVLDRHLPAELRARPSLWSVSFLTVQLCVLLYVFLLFFYNILSEGIFGNT